MIGATRPPFDYVAAGLVVPLRQHVADLRRRAADADWAGNTAAARAFEREADQAIEAGEDPVLMF